MIAVQLKGGLGNQMFQYAAARGISPAAKHIYFDNTFLTANSSSSETFTARKYELDVFRNVKAKIAPRFLLNILLRDGRRYRVPRKLFFPGFKKFVQEENEFLNQWREIKNPAYLDGYFQSEKYFLHIRNELLTEFRFPDIIDVVAQQKIQSRQNPVSIHIRRGDYLNSRINHYHGILPGSYYEKAVSDIEKKITDPYYFIFSDDTHWCEQFFQFLEGRCVIMHRENSRPWEDMYFMSQCRHHIIANSSFSWWGAWLSVKENGLNIAPRNWFNPAVVKFNIKDIIPDSWQVIHYD